MSITHWLKRYLTGNSHKHKKNLEEKMLARLKLKDILDSHRQWKENLMSILEGETIKAVDIAAIAQDHLCIQGKWLYGPGKEFYADLSEYKKACQAHTEFHRIASDVVKAYQNGNTKMALGLLDDNFRFVSNKNQQELARLFSVITNQHKE